MGVLDYSTEEPQYISNFLPVVKMKGGKSKAAINDLKRQNIPLPKLRMTSDVRALNRNIQSCPIQSFVDLKDIRLKINNCYFSSLDAKDMYFSVKVTQRSSRYLAMHNPLDYRKSLVYRRMPQGLVSAPLVCARMTCIMYCNETWKEFLSTVVLTLVDTALGFLSLYTAIKLCNCLLVVTRCFSILPSLAS